MRKLQPLHHRAGITSLAVTNYAFRDQIDRIEVALSRKYCTVHLVCKYEKGQCNCKKGQIWPADRTLGTTDLLA